MATSPLRKRTARELLSGSPPLLGGSRADELSNNSGRSRTLKQEPTSMNRPSIALALTFAFVTACASDKKPAEDASDASQSAADKTSEAAKDTEEAAEKTTEAAGDKAEEAGDKVKEKTKDED
jgi:hypothetical protein